MITGKITLITGRKYLGVEHLISPDTVEAHVSIIHLIFSGSLSWSLWSSSLSSCLLSSSSSSRHCQLIIRTWLISRRWMSRPRSRAPEGSLIRNTWTRLWWWWWWRIFNNGDDEYDDDGDGGFPAINDHVGIKLWSDQQILYVHKQQPF